MVSERNSLKYNVQYSGQCVDKCIFCVPEEYGNLKIFQAGFRTQRPPARFSPSHQGSSRLTTIGMKMPSSLLNITLLSFILFFIALHFGEVLAEDKGRGKKMLIHLDNRSRTIPIQASRASVRPPASDPERGSNATLSTDRDKLTTILVRVTVWCYSISVFCQISVFYSDMSSSLT